MASSITYNSLKKLINAENRRYSAGTVDAADYASFWDSTMTKLDIFLTMNRITSDQYNELVGLRISTDSAEAETE